MLFRYWYLIYGQPVYAGGLNAFHASRCLKMTRFVNLLPTPNGPRKYFCGPCSDALCTSLYAH